MNCTCTDLREDVVIFALATTCTTVVSIIQQCNYIANWHTLRVEQYEQSVIIRGNPALALGPLSRGFNAVLFWIILYFYNVDSVTMLFWYAFDKGNVDLRCADSDRAIALVFSVWNIRLKWVQRFQTHINITSKILAVVLPALFSALRKGFQVNAGFIGTLILMNFLSEYIVLSSHSRVLTHASAWKLCDWRNLRRAHSGQISEY